MKGLCARLGLLAIVLSAVFTISAGAQQGGAPTTAASFRVGARSIAIPAPPAGLEETGSDYRVLLDVLVPSNNRMVAAFVPPAVLQVLTTGKRPALTQYALVEVPRTLEFTDLSPAVFGQIVDTMNQQFGAVMNSTLKDQQDDLNRRLKALNPNTTAVTIDKPVLLGSLFSKQDAAGYGMIAPVTTSAGATTKMAAGVAVLRTHERVLFAYFYTVYKDEDTIKSVRTISEQWVDSILAANQK